MTKKKEYNLNTKYGRRKAREQAYENYQNLTPEEKQEHDSYGCMLFAVIIGIVVIIILASGGGTSDILKWFSR